MILRITNSSEEYGIDVCKISLEDFADKARHPFIATSKWDAVYIDLNDDTPRGILKQLIQRTKVIPVFDKKNINPRVMALLCEVVPDSAANLRSTFLKDKNAFNALVEELISTYKW